MPAAEFLNAFSGNLGEKMLGPKYVYATKIKNPKELGMSPEGSMGALAKDVAGIISYTEILIEGGGNANKVGKPLGDRFFLKTAADCKDVASGKTVKRSHYVNNQIDGSIPGLSGLTGYKSSLKGLIPGIIANIGDLNPLGLMAGFVEGSNPPCKAVKKTIISDTGTYKDTAFVALNDLEDSELTDSDREKLRRYKKNMENNDTEAECNESFQNIEPSAYHQGDLLPRTYVLSISLFMVYLLYKLMHKKM